MSDNNAPESRFTLVDLNTQAFPANINVDLVVSLLSWGFHFPLEIYLDEVLEILADDGCLIIDLRKNQNGVVKIMSLFSDVKVVNESFRHVRVVAKR